MYGQYPSSEQKQWEAKVKLKATDPIWSQFFPVTVPHCKCPFDNLVGKEVMTI